MVSSRRSARKTAPSKNSDNAIADGNSEDNKFSLEHAKIVDSLRDSVISFKSQVLDEIRLIRTQIHENNINGNGINLQSNITTPAVNNNNMQSMPNYPTTTSTTINSDNNIDSNNVVTNQVQTQSTTQGQLPLSQNATQIAQVSAQQQQQQLQQQQLQQHQMQLPQQQVVPPVSFNSSAPTSLAAPTSDMNSFNNTTDMNMNMNVQQLQTGVYPINPATANANGNATRGNNKRMYDDATTIQQQQLQQPKNIAPSTMSISMTTDTSQSQSLKAASPKTQGLKPPSPTKAAKHSHTQSATSKVAGKEMREESIQYQVKRRAIFNTKLNILQNKNVQDTIGTPNLMNRLKSHWDYVLDEAQWMAIDYRQERRWKLKEMSNIAAQCSHEITFRDEKKAKSLSSNAQLIEDKQKRIDRASLVSSVVDNHWKSYLKDLNNEYVPQNILNNHGHRVDEETNDQYDNKMETDFQSVDAWNKTVDMAITTAKTVLKEPSSSSSKKKDDYDGLTNDFFVEQKTLFEKIISLNEKNIGAIVYGPSYHGKTFVMTTVVKYWLKLASQLEMRAADGCNHAVLIMCSQASIHKWQHQLQRCAQDYKILVWGHHWNPHSNTGNDGNDGDNDNEEDIVHYGDADIVLCAIESFVSSAGGNSSDNGVPKTLVQGNRLLGLRPWTGVMVDFRGLEEDSQWHYRKEFFDGQIEPSSNEGITSKYSKWDRFRWLPNLVACLKQTCTQRCILSDYSLVDSDMTKNSTMTYSTERKTTAAIVSFCMPAAFDYNFEYALKWLKSCEKYKESDTSMYTKPFEALLALELLLHMQEESVNSDGRKIVEEIVSLDMDFPQSKKYNCMLHCLMAQQALAGDDIRLMSQACMLLQRVCFHEGLVCSARLGVYNIDNMSGRPSTEFMRTHAARLSSTDLLSLDRYRIISSANQFIYRSLYQFSHTINNAAVSSPKGSHSNNNTVTDVNEVSRPLSPLNRFAPGFNRGNLNCSNNFLFSNRRLRSKGSCKLRALKGILELYSEDRIVIIVDTINEEQLVHQHLNEEGTPHLYNVTNQLDGSGDAFYNAYNHFSFQHKIASFNQDLDKPCIMICRFDSLFEHGCLPYNTDVFLVLSQNWARKLSLKEMFQASYKPFPKMKDVKIINVVVKGSLEEPMITAGGSLKELQGKSPRDGIADLKLANAACVPMPQGNGNSSSAMEVDKEKEAFMADIRSNALNILSLWKCSQNSANSNDNVDTSTATVTSTSGMGKGKGIIVRDSTGSAISIASNHSRSGGSSNQTAWQQWMDALRFGIQVSEYHFERTARGGLFVNPFQMNTAHGLNLEIMEYSIKKQSNRILNLLEFIPPREEGDALTTVNGAYTGSIFNHSCYHREKTSTFGYGLKNICGIVTWKKQRNLELQMEVKEMKLYDLNDNELSVANISKKLYEKFWNRINSPSVELMHHDLRHQIDEGDSLLRSISKFETGHNTFIAASTENNTTDDAYPLTLIPGINPQDTPSLWPQASKKISLPITSFESFRSTSRNLRRKGIPVDSLLHVHPLQNASRHDINTVQSWQQKAGKRDVSIMIKVWKGHATSEPSRKAGKIQSRVEQKKRSLDIPLQIGLGARSMEFNAGYGNNSNSLLSRHGYNYSLKPIFTSRRIPRGIKEPNIRLEPWTQDEEAFIMAMLNVYGKQSWRMIEYLLNQRPQSWGKVRSLRQIRDRHRRIANTEDIKNRSAFAANDMTQYFTSENEISSTSNADELHHWLRTQTSDASIYENKFIHRFVTVAATTTSTNDSNGNIEQKTDAASSSASGTTMDVAEAINSDVNNTGDVIGQEQQSSTALESYNTIVSTSASPTHTTQEEPHSIISASNGVNILGVNTRALKIFEQRQATLVASVEARPNFPFHSAYPRVIDSDRMTSHESHQTIVNDKQINGSLTACDILNKLR